MISFKPLTKRDKELILKNVKSMKELDNRSIAKNIFQKHKLTYLVSLFVMALGFFLIIISQTIGSQQFNMGLLLLGFGGGVLARDLNLSIRATRLLPFLLKLVDPAKVEDLLEENKAKLKPSGKNDHIGK